MNAQEAKAYLKAVGADMDHLNKVGTDAQLIDLAENLQRLEKVGKFHVVRPKDLCLRCKSMVPALTKGLCDNCLFDRMTENFQRGVRA